MYKKVNPVEKNSPIHNTIRMRERERELQLVL